MKITNPYLIDGDEYVTIKYTEERLAFDPAGLDTALKQTAEWIRDFIGKPHPRANKHQPICPRVPDALEIDSVYLRLVREPNLNTERLFSIATKMADDFFVLPPTDDENKVLKAVFLVIAEPEEHISIPIIDTVQRSLKGDILRRCIMLGRFHSYLQRGSIHNKDFNPHRAPVPLLSLRYMVETDVGFLSASAASSEQRRGYLQTYLELLGESAPKPLKEKARKEIQKTLP